MYTVRLWKCCWAGRRMEEGCTPASSCRWYGRRKKQISGNSGLIPRSGKRWLIRPWFSEHAAVPWRPEIQKRRMFYHHTFAHITALTKIINRWAQVLQNERMHKVEDRYVKKKNGPVKIPSAWGKQKNPFEYWKNLRVLLNWFLALFPVLFSECGRTFGCCCGGGSGGEVTVVV